VNRRMCVVVVSSTNNSLGFSCDGIFYHFLKIQMSVCRMTASSSEYAYTEFIPQHLHTHTYTLD
jgi:hypothetical protein